MSAMNGYKTYLIAAAGVLYAVCGFVTGNVDANTAVQVIVTSLGLAAVRHGVANAA